MKPDRRVQVLSRIQAALDRQEQPTPPSLGLTEKEFREMAGEQLFELMHSSDEPQWSDFWVEQLTDKALGLISNAEPLTESRAVKISRVAANALWDCLKIALGVVLGWWLKKYFP